MHKFYFFQLLNDEIREILEYHLKCKTIFIKEITMHKNSTVFIYDELTINGFHEHKIELLNRTKK